MVDTFEIIEKPEICQFSENLGKMIIRNKNSSLTCVYMTVRLDDATICDKLTLYYDAEFDNDQPAGHRPYPAGM